MKFYQNTKMVESIKERLKLSPLVEMALKSVDRAFFVPSTYKNNAYSLDALPLEDSQWISSSLTVAMMSEAFLPEGADNVLEVGCGSGYQAMVLSKICRRVCTIERIEQLFIQARRRFISLDAFNIFSKLDDGQNGWEEYAPFDGIMFSACISSINPGIIDQLKNGGVLLAPMYVQDDGKKKQAIMRFVKNHGVLSDPICISSCLFVDIQNNVTRI